MSFFNRKNETEKPEAAEADDKITLDDLAYLVYQIAEKVGVDLSSEDEEDSNPDEAKKQDETDQEKTPVEDSKKTSPKEETKEGKINSSIDDFLLSKGLTADEVKKVAEYYGGEKEKPAENSGQPEDTGEKELEKDVDKKEEVDDKKEEKENSADAPKTSKIKEIQKKVIQNSTSVTHKVATESERVKLANAKYSISE